MLSSGCALRIGWFNLTSTTIGFTPPPSLHAQDDILRPISMWSSVALNPGNNGGFGHICLRSACRTRRTHNCTKGTSNPRRSVSCLRGGSAQGEPDKAEDAPKVHINPVEQDRTAYVDGMFSLPTTETATPPQYEYGRGQTPRSVPQKGSSTPVNFGISLVTERSTATGGNKGMVSYSLLADGTLRVGNPRQEHVPRPPPAAEPASAASMAPAAVLSANNENVATTSLRTLLQALYKGTSSARCQAEEILKSVTHETRAIAAMVRQCAVQAGVTVRGGLMSTFLPAGYPDSVSPEYLRYRCWDILQDLSSHLRGVLATQAVLEGMGVGRADSTPLAATLQWMARDGASMIGGLLFTSVASANFGVNIKTWRLFADASNDVGLALEMLAPLPAFREGGRFLRLICVASVFKAACGVAGGATGAAITEHWAVDNNIADVGAKNGAQHTVASLLGLGLSVWFARAVSVSGSASGVRVWGWYLALTAVHLLANYAAMRTLALRSLNPSRVVLLVREYLQQTMADGSRPGSDNRGMGWMGHRSTDELSREVLSPSCAARRERILVLPAWLRALRPWGDSLRINVGAPVRSLVREADDLLWLTSLYHEERAMVEAKVSYQPLAPRMGTTINVALREDASPEDRLQAMFQAVLINRMLVRGPDKIPQGDPVDRTLFLRRITEEALAVTRREFPAFRKALLRDGWDLSRVILGGGPWVGRWGSLCTAARNQ